MAPEDLPKRRVATSASESFHPNASIPVTASPQRADSPSPIPRAQTPSAPPARSALAATRGYLPRLSPPHYQSHAAVFWTYPIDHRVTSWLTDAFHQHWRLTLLHACGQEDQGRTRSKR